MQTYFFDIYDGQNVHADQFGDRFVGLHEAADQAVGLIMDLARETVSTPGDHDLAVTVRSKSGFDVYWASLMFRDSSSGDLGRSDRIETPKIIEISNPADIIRQSRTARVAMQRERGELEAMLDAVSHTFAETLELLRRPGAKAAAA